MRFLKTLMLLLLASSVSALIVGRPIVLPKEAKRALSPAMQAESTASWQFRHGPGDAWPLRTYTSGAGDTAQMVFDHGSETGQGISEKVLKVNEPTATWDFRCSAGGSWPLRTYTSGAGAVAQMIIID